MVIRQKGFGQDGFAPLGHLLCHQRNGCGPPAPQGRRHTEHTRNIAVFIIAQRCAITNKKQGLFAIFYKIGQICHRPGIVFQQAAVGGKVERGTVYLRTAGIQCAQHGALARVGCGQCFQRGDRCAQRFPREGQTLVDGVAFEGGKAEHYSLVLGSGSFIPGFEEQVVGHKAGEEFDVNVKFPEEYQAEELAGKDATFKIKLHEVQYKELPELDDDFAKDVSEYDTLDELKDSIRKGIETNHEKQADQKVENDLIDQVVGGMKAEIPDAMIESRIEELVQDFQYRISQQGLKLEQYLQYMGMTMEQFKEQFREQADKQVKMRLAMEAIVAKESIEATEEEFEAEIKRIADAYQMEADKVKSLVDAAAVKKDLAVNKAIDFVKSKANIVAGAAEEKKPAKKTTRKTTKKAAAKQDEEPKEEETKGE